MPIDLGVYDTLARLAQDPSFAAARGAIRPGFVPRAPGHPFYEAYRRYMREVEPILEDPERLAAILGDDRLTSEVFRLFGYRGDLDFTLAPDAWIRDLPLLVIGSGAYIGAGVVLGTGQMTLDGLGVALAPIAVGRRSCLNPGAILEGGAVVGYGAWVGAGAQIGADCHISDQAQIGEGARLGRDCVVGHGAVVGHSCRLGAGAVVDPGVTVPAATQLPAQHRLTEAGLFPLLQARIAA